ncbi:efflux RND transporter periplasmic adaptor subunit [Candidatus Berkiella aquae]|uniref:Efflux RND transporter periplasmic adaptor subunit n=1 Tax=Candidatus Berkiella aquae TaxID=295108 RepID=A0A0Q9YVC6_9GAMM|nr:efflux RND transporter periplasmic adaptor subunit [Candidatus Berkiella aquae]MCS5711307.1 efflux RND transporter periplasmic adaptor subunit [Candidatus Berkiella aquae]
MRKRMLIMLIGLGILFGGIFGYHSFKGYMTRKYMSSMGAPPVAVATMTAKNETWQSRTQATGSVRAIRGVDVTTEIAGMITSIEFKPGTQVKKGDLLVRLNDDTEIAQLEALQASEQLAQINYDRDYAQLAFQAVSQSTVDADIANLKNLKAQVEQQKTIIEKKHIRAPFSGRLGICYVNPGQYLNPGDKIVTLQTLDPIYVDFYLPQQTLVAVTKGQSIQATSDTYPGKTFTGKVTTINPLIDVTTRNVQMEATVANPKNELIPGMFANVEITTGKPTPYLTLPKTAIAFNPYGEIAYTIQEQTDKSGKKVQTAHQTFVTVGQSRGDQIAVLSGLKEGDTVVVSGQHKLKNGSVVIINNSTMPKNNPNPKTTDE